MHCLNVIRKLVWFEYYDVLADLVAGRNNMRNHLSKPKNRIPTFFLSPHREHH